MTQHFPTFRTNRRRFLAGATGIAGVLAMPSVLRAQTREMVVGGAASHRDWVETIVIPAFEAKHDCRVLFEGTRSLVNLEKMQQNADKPYLSVVQMDDPVMILADDAGLLEAVTQSDVPNMAELKDNTIHRDGAWVNYLQPFQAIAYNKDALPDGVASWEDLWSPSMAGRVVIPSLQNTEGVFPLFMAAALASGKPVREAQYDIDAGFKKLVELKPNILTIYTQMPQAFNLLETGEAWAIAGALSSFTMPRQAEGAPVGLAVPKEGAFASPSGVCIVKGGPHPELARAWVNDLLSPEIQSQIVGPTFSLPTNRSVAAPADLPQNIDVIAIDWAAVAQNRNSWVERWDREMAI
ncbi:ABC transporter substrate-binding protein [Aureimonas sp. SA4125]|uniref:ABC transporter substrate-binding protein n=1 Tax=Aureimonas sp. SA4125 TaxID=2826993 RepID=UPI001CC5D28F|nr:ABC transporter substrate-binding protein [Aureimonas sp. SA4125]BDA85755.1 ABC transporter substrate-binding protein [Aureimonas sp. SA4125]